MKSAARLQDRRWWCAWFHWGYKMQKSPIFPSFFVGTSFLYRLYGAPRRIRTSSGHAGGKFHQLLCRAIGSRKLARSFSPCPTATKKSYLTVTLFMARHAGFEPATYRFVAGHSIHWASSAYALLNAHIWYHKRTGLSIGFFNFFCACRNFFICPSFQPERRCRFR